MRKVLFLICILKFSLLSSQEIPLLLESDIVERCDIVTEVSFTSNAKVIDDLNLFDRNKMRSDTYSTVKTIYDKDGVFYTKVDYIIQPNLPHWFEINPNYIFNDLGERWSVDSNGKLLYYNKVETQPSESNSSLIGILNTNLEKFEQPPVFLLNSILPNDLMIDQLSKTSYKLYNDRNHTIWNLDSLSKTTKSFDDNGNHSYVQYEKFDKVFGQIVPVLRISKVRESISEEANVTRITKQTFSNHLILQNVRSRSNEIQDFDFLCTNDGHNLYLYSESYSKVDVMVYNQEGKLLHSEKGFDSDIKPLDISSYPSGIYYLNLHTSSFNTNIKFIKS